MKRLACNKTRCFLPSFELIVSPQIHFLRLFRIPPYKLRLPVRIRVAVISMLLFQTLLQLPVLMRDIRPIPEEIPETELIVVPAKAQVKVKHLVRKALFRVSTIEGDPPGLARHNAIAGSDECSLGGTRVPALFEFNQNIDDRLGADAVDRRTSDMTDPGEAQKGKDRQEARLFSRVLSRPTYPMRAQLDRKELPELFVGHVG